MDTQPPEKLVMRMAWIYVFIYVRKILFLLPNYLSLCLFQLNIMQKQTEVKHKYADENGNMVSGRKKIRKYFKVKNYSK